MARRHRLDPRGTDDREAMVRTQRAVAAHASFVDDNEPLEARTVVGVDTAFPRHRPAVGAAVVVREGAWIERTYVTHDPSLPYIPGLLAFREGPIALDAIDTLRTPTDVTLVDGNGRLHPRQAGLATHVGVVLDRPTIGVAKSLLCGRPIDEIDDLAVGDHVPIVADEGVDAPTDEVIGYAVQTRQFDTPGRHINPLFVSPGHRIGGKTAVETVLAACSTYKLPDAIHEADRYAATVSRRLTDRPKR